jgi:hypothetical protein
MTTQPMQVRDESNTELQFKSLTADLLTRFSGLAAGQIDTEIGASQQSICETLGSQLAGAGR